MHASFDALHLLDWASCPSDIVGLHQFQKLLSSRHFSLQALYRSPHPATRIYIYTCFVAGVLRVGSESLVRRSDYYSWYNMPGEFQHSLLSCFDNCTICIITYFAPCYTAGKVAEKVGESCLLHCLLTFVPVAGLICRTIVRGKVRDQKNIEGSQISDFCLHLFCGPCALCQEAQETGALNSGSMAQDMVRE
jgi:Cys-rich protein (TIGR01571 family)